MNLDAEFTDVIFRRFTDMHVNEVIALFPGIAGSYAEPLTTCQSYQHIGQHSPACIDLPHTRAATAEESEALHTELTRLGYRLNVVTRATLAHLRARHAQVTRQLIA